MWEWMRVVNHRWIDWWFDRPLWMAIITVGVPLCFYGGLFLVAWIDGHRARRARRLYHDRGK